jgi:eukaryotic-like serine/threonine-protein kinase
VHGERGTVPRGGLGAELRGDVDGDLRAELQQALGASYTIERELGGGGMARIFAAEETALGRTVVVKVLRPEQAEGLSAERFKREVRLAARLQHPHIVPLLTAGELPGGAGLLYYTMPFVAGETLRARLDREGAVSVPEAARLLGDVASALAYAHRRGVVHRDVKPENVLLSEGGALVVDFGIAKAIAQAICSGAM